MYKRQWLLLLPRELSWVRELKPEVLYRDWLRESIDAAEAVVMRARERPARFLDEPPGAGVFGQTIFVELCAKRPGLYNKLLRGPHRIRRSLPHRTSSRSIATVPMRIIWSESGVIAVPTSYFA